MLRASISGRARWAVVTMLGLACGSLGLSGSRVAAGDEPDPAVPRTGEAAILEALEETTDLEFVENPLSEVLDFIRDKHRVAMWIDHKSLEDCGVTCNLRGVRLRSALNLILKPLELTWTIQNEVLAITSKETADSKLLTKVQDVADLLDPTAKRRIQCDSLVDVIMSTIEPQSWDEGTGPSGIECRKTTIIFSQSREVHEQVARLLDDLRRARGLKTAQPVVEPPKEEAIHQALEKPWNMHTVDQPLSDVAAQLADEFHINVVLDERALEDCGVRGDEPVTIQWPALKLKDTLDLLLAPLELDWIVDADVLLITSREVHDSSLKTKVYPIVDLLDSGVIEDQEDLLFALTSGGEFKRTWDEVGGPGTIEALGGLLVVSQTRRVHVWIEGLLADMRKLPPPTAEPPKPDKVSLKVYRLDGVTPERMLDVITRLIEPASWVGAGGEGTIEGIACTRPGANKHWTNEGGTEAPPPAAKAEPATSPASTLNQVGGGGQTVADPVERLTSLPDGWLIIRQRESVHKKITDFLNDMGSEPVRSGGPGSGGGGGFF
ncbi:MAG: hypothetical protein AB7O62_00845 [Pirellulales bacterium]